MRLRKSQVRRLAHRICTTLAAADLATPRGSEEKVVEHLDLVITEDLMVEDKLNDEIRLLMEQYQTEIENGHVDYHRMFQMIKRKLVRERNLVL
jgi:hypothetical protein